jgi:hypothetical protein
VLETQIISLDPCQMNLAHKKEEAAIFLDGIKRRLTLFTICSI